MLMTLRLRHKGETKTLTHVRSIRQREGGLLRVHREGFETERFPLDEVSYVRILTKRVRGKGVAPM